MCAAVCQDAEHALLSGCTRLIPHSQRRASALHQADALAAVPCGHRVGAGRRPTNTRCLARGLGGPRVRRAGDDRPRYRPPLQPGCPGSTTGQPGIGVAGRRTRGREGCSVARALQPSVVVAGEVDLIGKERGLRDRVRQSLPGPVEPPGSRSSAGTWQPGGNRQQSGLISALGPCSGSVETGAEVVAVWQHGDG